MSARSVEPMKVNDSLSAPDYLSRDAGLPDMGSSGLGPRACTPADVESVLACRDLAALAQMRGYARSYFATAGGIALGVTTAVIGVLVGRRPVAITGVLAASMATMVTIEARRRARHWESVIDAAIVHAKR